MLDSSEAQHCCLHTELAIDYFGLRNADGQAERFAVARAETPA
jgi:hypothetical protein